MPVADAAGAIVFANEQATALFGHAPETLTAMHVDDLVPDAVRSAHRGHREPFGVAPL